MSCKPLMLTMICLVAVMMLTLGCGKGGDEPAEPNGDNPSPTTQPAVKPPVTPPDPVTPTPKVPEKPEIKIPEKPEIKIPEKPEIKIPEKPEIKIPKLPGVKIPEKPAVKIPELPGVKIPEKPAVKIPETPAVKVPEKPEVKTPAPDPPKAAGDAKIETGWSNVKVGTMVKFKMQNNMTMTQEVTKVTDDTVTVKVTTAMPAMPAPMVRSQDYPRYGKPAPTGKAAPENTKGKGKKLPDQTLTIGGKSLTCEVWEAVTEAGGKKITSRSYMCKKVPGWMVKSESDAMGSMATMMELVEFKE